ncbi:MAG: ATP-binding protein [Pseudomonadota bacterium]
MTLDIPVPFEKLAWFRKKVGIEESDMATLKKYRRFFTAQKGALSDHFFTYFFEIPDTKFFLEHEKRRGLLKKAWGLWFRSLFNEDFSGPFLAHLWKSGLRHVEVNIDHRFITLGYAVVRQFCHHIVRAEVTPSDQVPVMTCIDKMVDFCQLTETHAYIEATTRCDMEVIKGISHQMRNPLTVIGGNILRLQRKVEQESPVYQMCETILEENKRLEAMVTDTAVYSDMFQRASEISNVSIENLISKALEKIEKTHSLKHIQIHIDLDPGLVPVKGDPKDLETMLTSLLQNSIEAVDPHRPHIKITSERKPHDSPFIVLEIFNNGTPPKQEDIEHLFVPFYSSKSHGTGFGLPITQLAARRNLGEITIEPVPNKGTRCRIKLPAAA